MLRNVMPVLFCASFATAQPTTTYVMPTNIIASRCNSFFTHPTSFYQFTCVIDFNEQGGSGTGVMNGTNVLYFNPIGFGINAGSPPVYLSRKSKVLQDIAPANGQPGQATWEWQVQTTDNLYHVGLLSMQWVVAPCTRSGCQVHVLECETTVDQSTVAILDQLKRPAPWYRRALLYDLVRYHKL